MSSLQSVLSFDGKGGHVEIPYQAQLNQNKFTLSCWAKVTGKQKQWRSPVTCRTDQPKGGYLLYAGTDNKWQFWTGDGQDWITLRGTNAVLRAWTHLAAVYDGAEMTLYINGKKVGAPVAAKINLNQRFPLRIGAGATEGNPNYFFQGQIAEVQVWNQVRSQDEIQQSMNIRLTGKEAGLVGYWPLNEGSGNMTKDQTGNNNDGKIMGANWIQVEIPLEESPTEDEAQPNQSSSDTKNIEPTESSVDSKTKSEGLSTEPITIEETVKSPPQQPSLIDELSAKTTEVETAIAQSETVAQSSTQTTEPITIETVESSSQQPLLTDKSSTKITEVKTAIAQSETVESSTKTPVAETEEKAEVPITTTPEESEQKPQPVGDPVDLVIVIDTSQSMRKEAQILSEAATEAIPLAQSVCPCDLRVVWLGIEGTWKGTKFDQTIRKYLTQNCEVSSSQLRGRKRGQLRSAGAQEDAARAIEDISDYFNWRENATRAIFYLGDEALEGGGEKTTQEDIDAANLAIKKAQAAKVKVHTYFGTSNSKHKKGMAQEYARVASETGGTFFTSKDSLAGFNDVLETVVCGSRTTYIPPETTETETPEPSPSLSTSKTTETETPESSQSLSVTQKKRLVVCCDGIWNEAESGYPTNVVKFLRAIKYKADDQTPQMVFYSSGFDTAEDNDWINRLGGDAFGWRIDRTIENAYRFLCVNYDLESQDEIYLIGFSRGAYIVRCLASMIYKCGLLKRSKIDQIPQAYCLYRNPKIGPNDPTAQKFREDNAKKIESEKDYLQYRVPIKMLGCWDTVGKLGIPDTMPWLPLTPLWNQTYEFFDTKLSPIVENGFHAVAIDEKRKSFPSTPMQGNEKATGQVVKEVLFLGEHSCIGGGVQKYRGLSDYSLRWMINKAKKLGLEFGDPENNREEYQIKPDARTKFDNSITGVYTLGGEEWRPLRSPEVAIHYSVVERLKSDPNYRPPTLAPILNDLLSFKVN